MCGPLIVAINGSGKWYLQLVYHAGRMATYILLALLAKALGLSAALMDAGQLFSTSLGAVLIVVAILHFAKPSWIPWEKQWGHVLIKANHYIREHLKPVSAASRFMAGAANGLLPCGMVYLALAGAVMQPALTSAAAYMLLFGTGTLPALLFSTKALSPLGRFRRLFPAKAVSIALAVFGLVLVLRGLNLGIPYLSPQQPLQGNPITMCH